MHYPPSMHVHPRVQLPSTVSEFTFRAEPGGCTLFSSDFNAVFLLSAESVTRKQGPPPLHEAASVHTRFYTLSMR